MQDLTDVPSKVSLSPGLTYTRRDYLPRSNLEARDQCLRSVSDVLELESLHQPALHLQQLVFVLECLNTRLLITREHSLSALEQTDGLGVQRADVFDLRLALRIRCLVEPVQTFVRLEVRFLLKNDRRGGQR